ncbi:MAG: portal protein, partial [Bacteroidales bacterium]|nr:portal protein [Bacteroidales bacterium]
NQQHITSMVEDYWFANRSGGKGTQVDTIDETGNLGEINDILYFNKKLYKSMFIPSNRISINPDADTSFDYETTAVTKEDVKFFMFVSRLRQVYTSLFKELVKREIISTKVMSEAEYLKYEEKIEISFTNENTFIEKMNLDNFMRRLDIYTTAQEYAGKLFPVDKILKDVFKMSDEDIEENFKTIAEEEKDPKFKKFYSVEGEEDAQW